jgi:hypothetical protein
MAEAEFVGRLGLARSPQENLFARAEAAADCRFCAGLW